MSDLTRVTLTSMEVAQMVGKEHKNLVRDIRRYCEQLAETKIELGDFFTESTYLDANNQNRPCFMVTKKGCEFIAHKLTGQKGTEFTACYINRFHEMEDGETLLPEEIEGAARLYGVPRRLLECRKVFMLNMEKWRHWKLIGEVDALHVKLKCMAKEGNQEAGKYLE